MKKKCSKCGEDKELDEFNLKNKEKEIYQNDCRECNKISSKLSYERNKKTTYERNKRNRIKKQKWLSEYKKKLKCNRCPENHPATLDFHHKDSNEKEHTIGNLISTYSIDFIMNEIKKCEVLCANCHRKHHHYEK